MLAFMSAILSVFPKPRESVSLKKSCYVAASITSQYFHDFLNHEPCTTDLWFWEVLGQSQSWLRMMQTDLWKLYVNSRIFEFLTPCPKIKFWRMRKNVIVFL